jgi:hypothetical protein
VHRFNGIEVGLCKLKILQFEIASERLGIGQVFDGAEGDPGAEYRSARVLRQKAPCRESSEPGCGPLITNLCPAESCAPLSRAPVSIFFAAVACAGRQAGRLILTRFADYGGRIEFTGRRI